MREPHPVPVTLRSTKAAIGPEWPSPGQPDTVSMRNQGWRPTPFQQVVLKVQSRCNLDCDYCYVYQSADQSWRQKPKRLTEATLRQIASRVRVHALTHDLGRIDFVLHGGEPLLNGREYFATAANILRDGIGDVAAIGLAIQTNGVMLDEAMATTLLEHGFRVGVSLDGDQDANDRNRKDRRGRSSYASVAAALRLLQQEKYRALYGGILSTIDLANDPLSVWHELSQYEPPFVDFMLPHGNWFDPPPGLTPGDNRVPYFEWLKPIFDIWFSAGEQATSIRLFSEIIQGLLGGASTIESVGLSPIGSITIETDGTLEQVDSLKTVGEQHPRTGLDVFRNTLDDALDHYAVAARQIGAAGLSDACQRCHIVAVCGGGLYTHRYRVGDGFKNPSVYCADLMALIEHIESRMQNELRRRITAGSSAHLLATTR